MISINLTGAASGTFEAARLAAERTNAPGRIHVINSFNASLGQGQLVVFAAECANAGLSVETTLAGIRDLVPKTRTFALLNDLRYAVRGGRLPGWVKTVADLLRLTPVIRTTTSGKIATGSFLLGRRNRIRKFAHHIAGRSDTSRLLNVAIGHAICPEDAAEFERLIRERIPKIARLTITDLGAGLGAHGGPGTLLVAIQPHTQLTED